MTTNSLQQAIYFSDSDALTFKIHSLADIHTEKLSLLSYYVTLRSQCTPCARRKLIKKITNSCRHSCIFYNAVRILHLSGFPHIPTA